MNDVKQTNKQKEAIILKGIATSINAMAFPNFENLQDMLTCFDYQLLPSNLNELDFIEIYNFYHRLIKSNPINISVNDVVRDRSVLQKIYLFLTNAIVTEFDELEFKVSAWLHKPIKVNLSGNKTLEGINILANHPRIGVVTLPLGIHFDKAFSMTDFELHDSIDDILKIITKNDSDILIYRFCAVEFENEAETITKYIIRYVNCGK